MKHLNKILFAVLMVMSLSSHAQDENNEWAISFGVNAIDTKTSAGGGQSVSGSVNGGNSIFSEM